MPPQHMSCSASRAAEHLHRRRTTICWQNGIDEIAVASDGSGNDIGYNLTGQDPLFVDEASDLRLRDDSPAVDVGLPYNGSAPDLGAVESGDGAGGSGAGGSGAGGSGPGGAGGAGEGGSGGEGGCSCDGFDSNDEPVHSDQCGSIVCGADMRIWTCGPSGYTGPGAACGCGG